MPNRHIHRAALTLVIGSAVTLGPWLGAGHTGTAGQNRPDFSGRWVFDDAQTHQRWSVVNQDRQAKGLPGIPQAQSGPALELKQNGGSLIQIVQTRGGPIETTWPLDGETRSTAPGTTERARWRGGSIEITMTGSRPGPLAGRGATLPRTQVVTYSLEGPFLVVAQDVLVTDFKTQTPSPERQLSYYKRDASQTGAQPSVQYRSPAGVEYRSLPDTDAIKNARAAAAADPKNITRIIELGVAESGARQFREAIATFTRGLDIEPNNALLLRWRGHRYLSVREFDRASADLTRGGAIDPTIYGIWYHLGVLQYVRGDFSAAAASFAKAQPIAPDPGELSGSTDWLWMSLSRAGRGADAKAMLDRRPESRLPPITNAYTRRLQLYRGEIGPDAVVTAADTDEVQIATLAFGLGNWHLIRGDKTQARTWFERSVTSGGWPGFGFIASEAELRRLR